MNWDAIAAITETAGLIVIVASLIHISAQTKQANDHATASSETSFMNAVNDIFKSWSADEQTAKVTPGGAEILEHVKLARGQHPSITELIPWWRARLVVAGRHLTKGRSYTQECHCLCNEKNG